MMLQKKVILVVEDDEMIRLSLEGLLADEGYSVVTAIHGEEAIEYIKSATPDLILLDLMMPYMDGFQFRETQTKLNLAIHVPLIIMSARGNVESKSNHIEANAYLTKPFDIDELLEMIAKMLSMNGSSFFENCSA